MTETRARLRTVRQLEVADCGAACLATVLRSFGDHVPLADLRDLTSTGRDGVSALGIASAARERGYEATGLRVAADDLEDLPAGAILHWSGNHFVVFVDVGPHGVTVLDPAFGERLVPHEAAALKLSGVAVVVTPTRSSQRARRSRTPRLAPYRPFVAGAARPLRQTVGWAVAAQALALAYPLLLKHVVDDAGAGRSHNAGVLVVLAVGAGAAYLLAAVGRLLAVLALERAVDVGLSTGVLRHLVALPWSFLSRRSNGDLALRLRSTVVVRQILTSAALSGLLDGALVVLYLGLVAAIDGWFALLTLAVVLAQGLVVWLTWPRLRRAAAEALEAQTRSQDELLEIVENLEVLKASGAAARAATDWQPRLTEEVRAAIASSRLGGLVDALLTTLRFVTPLLLLAVGLERIDAGALTLGEMLGATALAAAVTAPTAGLLGTVCSLSTVAGYLDRLDDLLAAKPERTGGRPFRARAASAVELREVSFRYSGLLPPALRDVSLVIEPGEHVAVVGASGSGKSTLAMLVATLYEPSTGVLLFDDVDLAEYDLAELRHRIGVVSQGTSLLRRTVAENISFGRDDVSHRQVVAAAKAAAIHTDITALPSGYATRLGNGGSGLSGGQLQRLALARALAGRPNLLVLDEATSALDGATEERVHVALGTLRCTRLVIAHRISTVERADRVVVLEQGEIVAQGTYTSLRRREPAFRALLAAGGSA
jgi:ATP-binding cassette subfamily B protein